MAARVTQLVTEALVSASPNARVTQESREALVGASPSVRVTQLATEALVVPVTPAFVTQAGVEVVQVGTSSARTTQAGVEVVESGTSKARTTQAGVEAVEIGVSRLRATQAGVEVLTRILTQRIVPFAARFERGVSRTVPISGHFRRTQQRTVPIKANIGNARLFPFKGALRTTSQRPVFISAVLGPFRRVPFSGVFQAHPKRFVPFSGRFYTPARVPIFGSFWTPAPTWVISSGGDNGRGTQVPNPTLPPTVTVGTGGSLPAGTYTVGYTWTTMEGATLLSPTVTVTVGANGRIIVTPPTPWPGGVTGFNVYISAVGGSTLYLQSPAPVTSASYTQSAPINTTTSQPPVANTAWTTQDSNVDLLVRTMSGASQAVGGSFHYYQGYPESNGTVEPPGWSEPSYNDSWWPNAEIVGRGIVPYPSQSTTWSLDYPWAWPNPFRDYTLNTGTLGPQQTVIQPWGDNVMLRRSFGMPNDPKVLDNTTAWVQVGVLGLFTSIQRVLVNGTQLSASALLSALSNGGYVERFEIPSSLLVPGTNVLAIMYRGYISAAVYSFLVSYWMQFTYHPGGRNGPQWV